MTESIDAALERGQAAIANAASAIITAGAGMGVDSGLPDFRGPEGFWNAYPPYRALGLSFIDLANPRWFDDDPALAWGFYGHRLQLYRRTIPHEGFSRLASLAARLPHFVFTSNVDGQFERAGFAADRILECHGTIHLLQCTQNCRGALWEPPALLDVDAQTGRATSPLPRCPDCGAMARPNILMFGDGAWDDARASDQEERFAAFVRRAPTPMVVLECGAGTGVPTVRHLGEQLGSRGATLIRINVREPEVPRGHIGIALGAKDALAALLPYSNISRE